MAWIFHKKSTQKPICMKLSGCTDAFRVAVVSSFRGKNSSVWQRFFTAFVVLLHPKSAIWCQCVPCSSWVDGLYYPDSLFCFMALNLLQWPEREFPKELLLMYGLEKCQYLFLGTSNTACAGPWVLRDGVTVTLARSSVVWMTNSLWILHAVIFHPFSVWQEVKSVCAYI